MASHDGASSSSSSSVSSFTHDVFLSFRGPDTGNSFTAFLHNYLEKEGVDAYMDREDLRAGEEIKSALFKAIQGSKISIPVFSKGYADSKWCLIELVEIVRCHRDNGQIIVPIFFDVDPTDVGNQTGSFEASFVKHTDNFDEQTRNSWEEALKEVANISGYHLGKVKGNQSKLLDLVVERVLSESSGKRLDDVEHPVGLDARVKEVEDRLCIGSHGVQFVGIWGPGGIGKTAIAKTLYNCIFKRFPKSCFLADIKSKASETKGLLDLQKQLICSISKWKVDEEIGSVHRGRQLIKEKLQGVNVLLILDDVDSQSQLNALAIKSNWFGPSSRIVITSRDKEILRLAEVYEKKIYCPKYLDDNQSLQLFSLHAFSMDRPPEDCMRLSHDVRKLVKGLPLALEVLGSTFSYSENRKEEIQKTMLQEPEKNPHDEVYEKLKTSYNNLGSCEKDIFLDAASFFIGWKKETAILFWDACGFKPDFSIEMLTRKSLLKNTPSYDELKMHDQIQALGRRIVYEERTTEPSKCSRLWSTREEFLTTIEVIEAAQNLEAIVLNSDRKGPRLQWRNFVPMSKLRFLEVHVPFGGDFPILPVNLRWFISQRLKVRAPFCHKKLVNMKLRECQIKEAWSNEPRNKNERFQELKVLHLQYCGLSNDSLDFSWFPKLEILELQRCTNMVSLHESIGDLKSLVELNLREIKIEELPNGICSLSSLKVLTLKWCPSLKKLPESIEDLKDLVKLDLEGTKIEEIPSNIYKLSHLKVLILRGCSSLEKLPESIGKLESLVELDLGGTKMEEIPSSIYELSRLKVLILNGSSSSLTKLPELIGDLKNLVKLDLGGTNIEEIPSSINKLSSLEVLILNGCSSLKSLPELIGDLKNLVKLDLGGTNIEEIPSSIYKLSSLKVLILKGCSSLKKLPESIGNLKSLVKLDLRGTKIEEIPGNTLTDTPKKIHGRGTLLVDESQRIDSYSLNVKDGIYKGLTLCVVFELQTRKDIAQEGRLLDISLLIKVLFNGRISCETGVLIEGVEFTSKRDIIYVHHSKGFDWFGFPLEFGIHTIEVTSVLGKIKSSKEMPIRCRVKFWKVLFESTASELQQLSTNQEEEFTTTSRRIVADFFNWSDDYGYGSNSVPQQADEANINEMVDSHNDPRLGLGLSMIDSHYDLELPSGLPNQGGGQAASKVAEDPNLSQQALGLLPEML